MLFLCLLYFFVHAFIALILIYTKFQTYNHTIITKKTGIVNGRGPHEFLKFKLIQNYQDKF
ncbi:MAG: hypothetical protein A3H57_00095 [Candidatus Taylorbacteria bacterium RIFCSPLOWO2_02_FULL_43_11]|uniref:Uncharacterized protein n=1 Tax=Candidatus Taylorbacteria bacterium RIFCSPHIGHO2_02_FULL_43_32b TaxID=1802306 RepID=A0A1G2MIZ4_9BACT|nr:MAG: hypothetical protein A2743_01925 [Candidatus Taylorbacteria bacterium RIFCSPHIGHO2_01_FULL_43_47]OHA23837.1 MAG: hypothetical protein A3C72_01390 [Candidatus Taylorbacteria bacterium RIFCSPHIGHO2_02_FULL_43_32b]OHA37466.1 MAG: hypothetical protein A3H57_00095 [Candidatus Taylorbacteria bacterium RIFCSPLOWO2_02_FULL_43_11]